jgi:AraC-like DNA-binding protein
VKGIVEDKHGKLWLTTDNGLSHFDPETGICYNYYKSDGLITNQFYWNSAVKAPNGRILLGGTEGLTVLLGDNSKALHKGHLRFTSLIVANQTVHADGHYMDKDISITDNIRLHESDKSFEISFSALNYGPETQGVYSYRLKGFDDDWTQLPTGKNSVRYTNLPAGNYEFEVKYVSALNDTSDAIISMNVSVSPYFWKSWWFMAIVVIALLILAKYTYDKRIEVLRRREAERLLKPIEEALKNSEEPQQLQTRIENILENQHRIKASQIKSFEADSIELQSQERPFMERLTEVMEANYSNSEFGVAELSKELGISRSVLSKQIAAEIGESTSRFMCDYRLEVAKDILLKNPGNRNIAEIAFKVGFNDPKYFTRRFTKKFGSSPSTFKA